MSNKYTKYRLVLIITFALLAGAAGAGFGLNRLEPQAAADSATRILFAQKLPNAAGQEVNLADFRGKILVVNFWATWCTPCVEEIPEFSRMQTEFAAQGVQFVGLGIDSAENIAAFDKKIAPTYPLLVAGVSGSELSRQLGDNVGALPFTLVLDAHGNIKARKLGRASATEIRGWLKDLVKSGTAT